ncbi:MAG: iron-containing alcohol dehydrogenase [Planctomycetota bacterium]
MNFALAMPRRIVFGAGSIAKLDDLAHPLGRRFLLVFSRSIARETRLDETLRSQLISRGHAAAIVTVSGEPQAQDVDDHVLTARSFGADCVIGVGGGSTLDLAKAVAAIAAQPAAHGAAHGETAGLPPPVTEYLEGVGTGRTLVARPLPLLLAPTTAGTGSEATRNAVIGSREKAFKKSLRGDGLLAEVAVVDPALCKNCPVSTIATSGLDAVTQLIEPYLSQGANPLTDALVERALPGAVRALPIAWRDPTGAAEHIWADLCFASLCGGIALTNAGLGAVHGLAAALGARYPIPHGTLCAALLAATLEANRNALFAQNTAQPVLERMAQLGRWMCGREDLSRDQGIAHAIDAVRALTAEFGIPGLEALGVRREDYPAILADSRGGSSMRFNPVALNAQQLEWILEQAR